jgi:hypothetical protein
VSERVRKLPTHVRGKLPAETVTARPATALYQVSTPTGMAVYTHGELMAQRRRDAAVRAAWKRRQAAIARRDRQVRRFMIGFGAVVGLAVVGLLAGVCWLLASVVAASLPVIAVVAVVVLALGGVVGHRCVTIVQHWH